MFISYFLRGNSQPSIHHMYKITSQRMLSKTRHPSRGAISSHKAQYNIPVSPAEGMFSKVPQTENGNLLSEVRVVLFAGECEELFICSLVAHQIWLSLQFWQVVFKRKEPIIFGAIPAVSPAAITGQIDPLGYFIRFKNHVYVGDRKYVHMGASAHREIN